MRCFIAFPAGIGPQTRELAVQAYDGGPYVPRTLETVRDMSYPLAMQYYVYINKEQGKPLEPKADEFLRYILSQEGQNEVQRQGRYLPLTAEMVSAQLKKLE